MTNYQLKSATRLIAVSEATKKDIIKKIKVPSSRIEVIYEGVNNNLFKEVKSDVLVNVLKEYDIEKKRYFLFVGTIQPRKNLARLIKAFGLFSAQQDDPKIQLVVVGSKGWLSNEIYDLPKKLGIEDQIKFLGRVPDDNLPALYQGALAFVYPSLFEGFGLPLLEAMSCGCPVITSNISAMPEIAGDAAILIDPFKVEDIVQAMEKITKNDVQVDRLIQKGYKRIKDFSWQKCAEETLTVLEKYSQKLL